jgi:hypothetical protein
VLDEVADIKAPRLTEILREDYGYIGSVDLVRKRLAELRPRQERAAQKTGYKPGQVMQVDWAEMPTRPKILGRERRVYALVCTLPFSGASTAHFSFDMTIESFLQVDRHHHRLHKPQQGTAAARYVRRTHPGSRRPTERIRLRQPLITLTTPQKIILMADYDADPVWTFEDRSMLNLDRLPLTDELRRDLRTWAEWFNSLPDDGWDTPIDPEAEKQWRADAITLWRRLRDELGPEWQVGYLIDPPVRWTDPDEPTS